MRQCARDTLLWASTRSASLERPTSTGAVPMSARRPRPSPWITTTQAERGDVRRGPSLCSVRWVVSLRWVSGSIRASVAPAAARGRRFARIAEGGRMSTQDDLERTELLATRSPAADPPVAGDALPPGARLGRYRIEALLGRGGMGEVYRAEQLEPVRRIVALKLLRAQKVDARHRAYFEMECQLLAQMRHPAIAK